MEHIKLFEEFIGQESNMINESVLLRKMTRKSKLGFDKYAEYTVSEILKVNKQYLKWCYYNYNMITFMDDILEEIGISEEERIPKPGRNPYIGYMIDFEKNKNFINKSKNFIKLSDEEKKAVIKEKEKEYKEKRLNYLSKNNDSKKKY